MKKSLFYVILHLMLPVAFFSFCFGSYIVFNRLIVLSHKAEFKKGELVVEKTHTNRGNKASSESFRSVLGKVKNKEKRVLLNNYPKKKFKDFPLGSSHEVWYHTNYKKAFLVIGNESTLQFPEYHMGKIYSAIYLLILPFLILLGIRHFIKYKSKTNE